MVDYTLKPLRALGGYHQEKIQLLSYHVTAIRAVKETPLQAKPAVIDELSNLSKKGVLTPFFEEEEEVLKEEEDGCGRISLQIKGGGFSVSTST